MCRQENYDTDGILKVRLFEKADVSQNSNEILGWGKLICLSKPSLN
jgi:hypothetical protein